MVSRSPYLNINSMKRKITLLLISILTVSVCFAQNDDDRWRKKYSNFGYLLLSEIIEKVSGKPYEQFIREEVLRRIFQTTLVNALRE